MDANSYPNLDLNTWKGTRDTLWAYVKIFAAVRRRYSDQHPFWWHVTLYVTQRGLTTGPVSVDSGTAAFELCLDLRSHRAEILHTDDVACSWPLEGQTPETFFAETVAKAAECGWRLEITPPEPPAECVGAWDVEGVERYGKAIERINAVFERFRDGAAGPGSGEGQGVGRGECSPVHLFGHHFDLSLLWLSGRAIEGQDPADPENSSEQMTFGFSTGDSSIAEPYFYATAYPEPDGFEGAALPKGAYWNREGFRGAMLRYETAREADDSDRLILEFLHDAHLAGASRMRG